MYTQERRHLASTATFSEQLEIIWLVTEVMACQPEPQTRPTLQASVTELKPITTLVTMLDNT